MPKISFDKSWLLFLVAAAVFLAIKAYAADYAVSDENTYYKMGQLVAQGQVPYKDFFFAHPPLQIYLYAAVFKFFGFNFFMLKMLSAIAAVAAAVFVFLAAKEKVNREAAVAAAMLFLFSYGTLLFTNFATGTEFAAAFSAAAFYFFIRRKFATTGVTLSLAAVTTQLSAIVIIALFAATAFILKDKKAFMRMLLGFLPVFVVVNGVFLAAAKWEYVKQAVLYHMQKPSGTVDKSAVFFRVAKINAPLLIAAAMAFLSAEKKKLIIVASAAIAVAYVIGFPLAKASFNYYLYYAFPFLAILAAYGILAVHSWMVGKLRLRKEFAAAAIAAALLVTSFASAKEFIDYDFQAFPQAEEIADYIRSNSAAGGTIFGDDSTVPLISLLSGREIALNYVDNNVLRYSSGVTELGQTLQLLQNEVDENRLKLVILRKIKTGEGTFDFGIATKQQFTGFVNRSCTLVKEFPLEWRGLVQAYEVYDCLKTRD